MRQQYKNILIITAGIVAALLVIGGIAWKVYDVSLQGTDASHRLCSKLFNDKNPVQLDAARQYGIVPPETRAEAQVMTSQLVKIEDTQYYKVDRLTHSIPYLTKGGSSLLEMISKNFAEQLQESQIAPYRLIVTSLLRTREDVHRLREVNVNASKNSPHCYATTFDITYARFDAPQTNSIYRKASKGELKRVLMEVLRGLQLEEKCYVKYERKQQCFHITTRMK